MPRKGSLPVKDYLNQRTGTEDADICANAHRKDGHSQRGVLGLDRECKGQDPGQGGNPSRPAATHLCWEAVGGWPHSERLQRSEGGHGAPRPSPSRRILIYGRKSVDTTTHNQINK